MRAVLSLAVLLEKAREQWRGGQPFVLYRKPNDETVRGLFQKNTDTFYTDDFKTPGYVFAPFSGKALLIPAAAADFFVAESTPQSDMTAVHASSEPVGREAHMALVRRGIEAIHRGSFEKVVLSRQETLALAPFDFGDLFAKMLRQYPAAYIYVWFHPATGFWLGAFAEQLLWTDGDTLRTMAVAGTQPWSENLVWGAKEQREQQLVTDFIVEELTPLAQKIQVGLPYSFRAGHLAHLKTDIMVQGIGETPLAKVIEALHPTPAVCGLPKKPTLEFILAEEGYDRKCYAGFHGELRQDFVGGRAETDLYVNLRCLQLTVEELQAFAHIFVGGGITADSDPEAEWQETVNKAETMKKLFN